MVVIALVPAVYLLIKWETLPEIVPVHFNGTFNPDAYGHKRNLWKTVGMLAGASLLTYLLLENIHKFDPKRVGKTVSATFQKLSIGIVIFMSAIGTLVVMSSEGGVHSMNVLLQPVTGFLFVFLGNIMYNLKPNYIAGVRLPWTLNSDENWRLTHRFTGKLWFVIGLLIVLSGLVTPISAFEPIIIVSVILLAGLPIAYSYSIFKKEQSN